jgi:FkbM family methyltransferase
MLGDTALVEEVAYLNRNGVSLIFDVGANSGQTGVYMRRHGYQGRMVSFEPIAELYTLLCRRTPDDALWTRVHSAIGEVAGPARIGVSENKVANSLLPNTDRLLDMAAACTFTRYEDITVQRLDAVLPLHARPDDVVHVKIDAQGFERFVMAGAAGVLDRIFSVRMEVAVTEIYEGETILPDMITYMTSLGFILVNAWPAWLHPKTREVMHFDLMFRNVATPPVPPATNP